ncbi:MAG: hypothetical protein ACK5DD_07065 [Cyclobacteriaceae bacterium]|jgi:hypothetical protein
MKAVISVLLTFVIAFVASAQKTTPYKHEAVVLFGINQPLLLSGFNMEVNYFTPKLVFDYSHGVSLEFANEQLPDELMAQKLAVHLPYSTGFGIGYRFTRFLNLRVEPKWHRFEMYYDDESQTEVNRIVAYNTFTLGLGLYGRWMPFEKKQGFIKNIMIAPSVRYWPNVSTSLENDQFSYENKFTGEKETLKALNIGAGNTPWVVNVSIGYRFLAR